MATETAMEEGTEEKWEGEAWVELKSAKAEEIWVLFQDFCGIYKWVPSLETSYQVEGDCGKPGLVRYCAGSASGESADSGVRWVKEKLLTVDPLRRCLSYQVLDNNMGFGAYVATIEVAALDGDENGGCKIKWSFVCAPIQGRKIEDFVTCIDRRLRHMAQKMELSLQPTVTDG